MALTLTPLTQAQHDALVVALKNGGRLEKGHGLPHYLRTPCDAGAHWELNEAGHLLATECVRVNVLEELMEETVEAVNDANQIAAFYHDEWMVSTVHESGSAGE